MKARVRAELVDYLEHLVEAEYEQPERVAEYEEALQQLRVVADPRDLAKSLVDAVEAGEDPHIELVDGRLAEVRDFYRYCNSTVINGGIIFKIRLAGQQRMAWARIGTGLGDIAKLI